MKNLLDTSAPPSPALAEGCWNTIGVRGDRSCPELTQYTHCRNCPVYAATAVKLLDVEPTPDYITSWTWHFATPHTVNERDTQSVVIFRIGTEWLALATSAVTEVAGVRPVHALPHHRGGAVEGLASVHGELLIVVSLARILGLESSGEPGQSGRRAAQQRFLVVRRDEARVVFRADEVHGIQRFHPRELKPVPSTVARSTATYSKDLLPWNGHSVGVLDDQLLFYTLKRTLA
jgi:chemotaxis-related protein WspD